MVSDKTFKVAVIALLILILGAMVGSFIPDSFSDIAFGEADEFLEFEDDLVLFDDELLYYRFETHTLYSFSQLFGEDFSSVDDLLDFAESFGEDVEIEHYDPELIEIFWEDCFEDDLDRFVCEHSSVIYFAEDDVLEYVVEGFLDE